jgi:hypothetical protein
VWSHVTKRPLALSNGLHSFAADTAALRKFTVHESLLNNVKLLTVTVTLSNRFATGHGILPPLSRARIRRTQQKKIEQQQE